MIFLFIDAQSVVVKLLNVVWFWFGSVIERIGGVCGLRMRGTDGQKAGGEGVGQC